MSRQSNKPPRQQGFSWGEAQTRHFYDLTPERILTAVESAGYMCSGRCQPLNSMENRVLDITLEYPLPAETSSLVQSDHNPSHLIAKFYRPGRWTDRQILEEHSFLEELAEAEIPVVAPLKARDGRTLMELKPEGIYYALFPRIGGRSPDELSREQLLRVGALLGRMHNVAAASRATHRLRLEPETYGHASLQFLDQSAAVPAAQRPAYFRAASAVLDAMASAFAQLPGQRLHGDAHRGNLLWSHSAGPFWVDFDDMVTGPAVQDLWLLTSGRDDETDRDRDTLLQGYEQFRSFDYSQWKLVEPLRALRFIHFSAWIAKRWSDPAFPRSFPFFADPDYWTRQSEDLWECLDHIDQNR